MTSPSLKHVAVWVARARCALSPFRFRWPGIRAARTWRRQMTILLAVLLLLPSTVLATSHVQETPPQALLWAYLAGALAYLVPLGLVLLVLSGLEGKDAQDAAFLVPGAVAVASLAYIAVGFAFEFGGVGLMDARHGFSLLVWEWSALPEQYGPYWGMAGFAGWFLSGGAGTPEAVALFFGHLPWVLTAALIPALVVRRRTPSVMPLLLSGLVAGLLAPVAGNWVHGGGWLARLGTTLGWGHGYVDFAGSAQVGLIGAGVGLAALLAFRLRRKEEERGDLPAVHHPTFALMGLFFLLIGTAGWALNNPLYDVNSLPLHRILTNALLGVAGGAALPALYTWFVAGHAHPHMVAAGALTGWLSVLAGLPFLPAEAALGVGLAVGLAVLLVIYVVREVAALDDPAGVVTASFLGGVAGPLAVAGLADGRYSDGWHGITGPLASWLNKSADWTLQGRAQLAGVAAHFLWAFLVGSIVCVGLAVLWWAGGQVRNAVASRAVVPQAEEASALDAEDEAKEEVEQSATEVEDDA